MKKIYFFLLCFCIFNSARAQIVSIPDTNFKAKLLGAAITNDVAADINGDPIIIDVNGNNEIEISEAQSVYRLNVSNLNSVNSIKITSLSGLEHFSNLVQFYCYDNLLTNVNVSILTSLTSVGCDLNQITDLNISGLDLTYLSCEQNQIAFLDLQGMVNLEYLNSLENELTSLDLNGLVNLRYLRTSHNPISVLDFSGLTNIESLQCMDTQITTLDVSQQHYLDLLMCGSNPLLVTLFMKNGKVESGLNLEYLPALQYVCADEAQLAALENHLSNEGTSNLTINSYCSFSPGGVVYTIQGSNTFDFYNDGCDVSDVNYPFMKFSLAQGSVVGTQFCNASGLFSFPVGPGAHTITPILENPAYFNVSPPSVNMTFPDQESPTIQNFCITPNGSHPDVEIVLLPLSVARPGFDAFYKIVYKNKGNQVAAGAIQLEFGEGLELISSAPAVVSQTDDTLYWDYVNMQPFEIREIDFVFNVNSPTEVPPIDAGTVLDFSASISLNGDENSQDNVSSLQQVVVNSMDPNDKTCLEGAAIAPSTVGDYVHYVIRFENLGTFYAQNIVVKDMIDSSKFDVSTLIPIAASDSFITRITGNKVEFIFEDINLPFDDANNDGFIAFKIKTKPTLVLGNTFSNTASIYFDYNYPIITNTATTSISTLSNQDVDFDRYLSIFPNPAGQELNIAEKSVVFRSISIFNMLGQPLIVIPIAQDIESVDVSTLQSGTYFIKVFTDRGAAVRKFVKQ